MQTSRSVVINAAGIGRRIGAGKPKSLIEIQGKPIIQWQLEQLTDVSEVIVVVGFEAKTMIELVHSLRKDVTIVVNHDYISTGTAASLSLGSSIAGDRVISLDGDLLVRTKDLERFINSDFDLLGVTSTESITPVFTELANGYVTEFSFLKKSNFEWSGLISISRSASIELGSGHVFEGLRNFLPMKFAEISCVEIDEPSDILKAKKWLEDGKLYE
jgi:choline kinase